MKTFPVKYFDGLSSFGHQATLNLKEDSWLIEYERRVFVTLDESITNDSLDALIDQEEEPTVSDQNTPIATDDDVAEEDVTPPFVSPIMMEKVEVVWELAKIQKRETISNTNTFYYGDFPRASIECQDVDFPRSIYALHPTLDLINKRYLKLFQMGARGVAMLAFGLITFLVLVYLFVLPPIAESAIQLIPQAYEQILGDKLFTTIGSEYKIDREQTDLINEFAKNIDFNTPYNIRILVVKDHAINAFAVPGGRIVVFSGLLNKMKNHEELVALLGHEVAHVHQRHSLKAMARAFAGYLFVSAIFTDINGMTATITENAQFLQTMQYSRSAEAEADAIAAETMIKNKINLKGLVDLFHRLEHDHENNTLEKAMSFVSSHPQTEARKKFAKQQQTTQKTYEKNEVLEGIWQSIKRY